MNTITVAIIALCSHFSWMSAINCRKNIRSCINIEEKKEQFIINKEYEKFLIKKQSYDLVYEGPIKGCDRRYLIMNPYFCSFIRLRGCLYFNTYNYTTTIEQKLERCAQKRGL